MEFWDIFWNSIKPDDEMLWEIRQIDIFWKKTRRQIYETKNHEILIKTHRKIAEWIR